MPEEPHFALGALTDDADSDDHAVSFDIELTAGEHSELTEAITAVERCGTPWMYRIVERNFRDFLDSHEFTTVTLSRGKRFAAPDRLLLAGNVMSSIVNWLTAVRLFLDHTRTDLSRRFGKESPELRRFISATNRAYDDHVGYRFIDKFRNYVQHCGEPITRLEGRTANLEHPELRRATMTLVLDRDDLIATYDGWSRKVLADLRAMPASLDLLNLADDAMEGLRDVYGELLDINLEDAIARSGALVKAVDRLDAARITGLPTLFSDIEHTDNALNFASKSFDRTSAAKLGAVADGSATADSLKSERVRVPSRRLDITSLRESFDSENRGVQVLSVWYAVGPSPELFKLMNDIIESDRDVGPLITGLINVSGQLAATAALALGRTPEGLISGLLDAYESHQDTISNE